MTTDYADQKPAAQASCGRAIRWYRLHDLPGPAVHELIRVRESVFVVEQACAYQEADSLDTLAWHGLLHEGGALIGCVRIIPPEVEASALPAIGRVLVVADARGQGHARALMQAAIDFIETHWPGRDIRISAQTYLEAFYTGLGFIVRGAGYLEDGIPHIAMQRPATR